MLLVRLRRSEGAIKALWRYLRCAIKVLLARLISILERECGTQDAPVLQCGCKKIVRSVLSAVLSAALRTLLTIFLQIFSMPTHIVQYEDTYIVV